MLQRKRLKFVLTLTLTLLIPDGVMSQLTVVGPTPENFVLMVPYQQQSAAFLPSKTYKIHTYQQTPSQSQITYTSQSTPYIVPKNTHSVPRIKLKVPLKHQPVPAVKYHHHHHDHYNPQKLMKQQHHQQSLTRQRQDYKNCDGKSKFFDDLNIIGLIADVVSTAYGVWSVAIVIFTGIKLLSKSFGIPVYNAPVFMKSKNRVSNNDDLLEGEELENITDTVFEIIGAVAFVIGLITTFPDYFHAKFLRAGGGPRSPWRMLVNYYIDSYACSRPGLFTRPGEESLLNRINDVLVQSVTDSDNYYHHY